jgi:hypothetical protein
MDSSRLTEIKRNQTMAAFVKINPSMNNFKTELEVLHKNLGGEHVLFEGRLVSMQPAEDDDIYKINSNNPTQGELIQTSVMNALSDLFSYMATSNSGPTICSRIMYLFFFSITSSYNAVVGGKTGINDNWNWSKSYILNDNTLYSWIQQTLAYCLPNIIPGWSNGIMKFTPAFTNFSNDWDTWFAIRNTDNGQVGGSARNPPTSTQVPNITTFLDVNASQDISSFPQPAEWTPLSFDSGVTKKNYLTYGWGTVTSPSLSAGNETFILSLNSTPAYPAGATRDTEISDLLNMSETLTDRQKVIAEFWEGGANTITPPGMCLWFWKEYIISQDIKDLNILFFSGLDLTIGIFEASRLCWNVKGLNRQARPIQEIRRKYATLGATSIKYDGTTIDTRKWLPYQKPTFVTPPFPDFPSGHSTFSQMFAQVMTDWFGSTIQNQKVQAPFSQLSLLSPILKTSQPGPFGTFTITTGSSSIQPGVVPAITLTLSFTSWQEMADQAGLSRQYGGIHAASAHTGGQNLANSIRPSQKANWPLI